MELCWEEGYIQQEWTERIIVPLHNGGDETNIGNYRGITWGEMQQRENLLPGPNARLSAAVENGEILRQARGRFMNGSARVDQH